MIPELSQVSPLDKDSGEHGGGTEVEREQHECGIKDCSGSPT